MAELINLSELIPTHTGLQICISDTNPVQVLQWQCEGKPVADLQRGVYSDSILHLKKSEAFIKLAKDTNADLVITPEYSFPNETLDKIIYDTSLWPSKGALWCLGMEGSSLNQFERKMDLWEEAGNTLVIRHAFTRLLKRNFVDALVYLFLIDEKTLCILPQFKTYPMSEVWNDYEVNSLCKGEVIYIFDLVGGRDDLNRFVSLLCSDALGIGPNELLDKTKGKFLTVFHAQLNTEPRHQSLRAFRKGLFDLNAGREIRLITLNWADATIIDDIEFKKPWSAFYKKALNGSLSKRDVRALNLSKGTFYALHNYTEIWYSHRKEHCKRFDINKAFQLGVSHALVTHNEPVTKNCYCFDSKHQDWVSSLCDPVYSIQDIIDSFGDDYDYPLFSDPHDSDAFFGLCFGHFLDGELKAADDEVVSRMMFGSDMEADKKRRVKASEYKRLITLLKRQRFPEEFINFQNNHRLYLDSETAETPHKFGNVYPKNTPLEKLSPYDSVLCIISAYSDPYDVEEQINGIRQRLHSAFQHRLIVYYRPDDSDEYIYYDLSQTRIDKATNVKSLSSIKE
ncbi:hypothetical protein NST28_23280 [Paenibacillus sp. FSL R10-2791]|uniref:hypothetical protein n=1 Tax=Paenibacillus sp. FSL R10-2791 TaxID=2954695 RepID=UPI0030FD1CD5